MVLSTLGDVLLSPEDFNPSHSYIQNILPWITEATTKWLTNDWGVGRNQDIPHSSSQWQPHKSYNFSSLQESDTAHEVIKMIYQEGSSYLTHLKKAFAFNLCRGSSSTKFCICWTTDLHDYKKEPSTFQNSGMNGSSLAEDMRQNAKQKMGKTWQQHKPTANWCGKSQFSNKMHHL